MTDLFVCFIIISLIYVRLRIIMNKNLVSVRGNEVFTDTAVLSEGLNMEHRSVVALLKTHQSIDVFDNVKSIKKRVYKKEIDVYLLSELQATLLISLMKNSTEVISFKIKLVKEFYRQRDLLNQMIIQKGNAEWLERRQETKTMRRELTDVIQKFVVYAKEQGSKSADKYFMNFSRMELSGLFLMEQRYPNARDLMSMRQLNLIEMADEAIAISLEDSMSRGVHYKDCYKAAKEKIALLAKIIKPSPLPLLLSKGN